MPNQTRSKSCIEGDFIAESNMLAAVSELLIEASKNGGNVSSDTLFVISIYLEGRIENLTTYFNELIEITGGSSHG